MNTRVERLLLLMLIFLTKGWLLLTIFPLIYLWKKNGGIEIYNIIKDAIFYKLLISLIMPYGNMLNESFRGILILMLIEWILFKKKYEFNYKKIELHIAILFILGGIWNFFSPAGINGVELYLEKYKILLLPLMLIYVYKDRKDLLGIGMKAIPLAILGRYVEFYKNDFSRVKIIELKGNTISLLSLIIPYTFFCFIDEKKKAYKMIYLILLLLGTWIMLVSGARGGLMASLIGIVFGLIVKLRWRGILTSGLIVTFTILGIMSSKTLENRFFKVKDFSTRSRYYLMDAGIYTFKKNLLFGSGIGNTQKYFIEYSEKSFDPDILLKDINEEKFIKDYTLKNLPDAHNIIIDFLAQYGVLGVIFTVYLFILIPLKILMSYMRNKKTIDLSILSSFVGYIVAGMSWSIWTRHPLGVIYFIFLLYIYIFDDQLRLKKGSEK